MNTQAKDLVAINRIGWDAIWHLDGWWVGNEKGVTCYADHRLARIAMTVLWQRDGGRQLNYRIKTFDGATKCAGDYKPRLSYDEAMTRYMKTKKPL